MFDIRYLTGMEYKQKVNASLRNKYGCINRNIVKGLIASVVEEIATSMGDEEKVKLCEKISMLPEKKLI